MAFPMILKDNSPRNSADAAQEAKIMAILDELLGKDKGAEMGKTGSETESPSEDAGEPGEEACCPACGQPLPSPEGETPDVSPTPEDAGNPTDNGPAKLSSIEMLLAKAKGGIPPAA